jgi:DNA-binding transcriptional MerR regulator/catechol 2,3-dioxygenase-like lactoylglutathione lyase family enzyme
MSEVPADEVIPLAEVSARTGLSAYTLRYYEQEGLLPKVARSSGGQRRYRQLDLDRLWFLLRLRDTAMPIATMRRFAELRREGESGWAARLSLVLDHRSAVRQRLALLRENLVAIDQKIHRHRRILRGRGVLPMSETVDGADRAFELLPMHHVQLAIPRGGEEECRAFWRGVLGMRELEKPPVLAARGGCWFRGGGLEVHLGVEDPFVPAKKAHPGLLVVGLEEVAAALEQAGHPVTWDDDFPGHDRFYVADPFGNRLEFLEPRPGQA